MVPLYHVLLHTIFGKRLMTYDEYVGYSVLCDTTRNILNISNRWKTVPSRQKTALCVRVKMTFVKD